MECRKPCEKKRAFAWTRRVMAAAVCITVAVTLLCACNGENQVAGNADFIADNKHQETTQETKQETIPETTQATVLTEPEIIEPELNEAETIKALDSLLVGIADDSKQYDGDVAQWTDEAIFGAIYRKMLWDGFLFLDSSYMSKAGLTCREDEGDLYFDLAKVQKITQDAFGREFPIGVAPEYIVGNELLVAIAAGESTHLTIQHITQQGETIVGVGTAVDNYEAFIGCFEAVFEKNAASIYGYTLRSFRYIDTTPVAGKLAASASSELKETSVTHYAQRVIDGSEDTAWVEGVSGVGINEWIKLETTDGSKMKIFAIEILLGYHKSSKLLENNGWPSKVLVECENGYTQEVEFFSCYVPGTIVLQQPQTIGWIRIKILDAEAGIKYEDTCITEIYLYEID